MGLIYTTIIGAFRIYFLSVMKNYWEEGKNGVPLLQPMVVQPVMVQPIAQPQVVVAVDAPTTGGAQV